MEGIKCYRCAQALVDPHDCKLLICNNCKLPGHIYKLCPFRSASKSAYDGTLCSLCQARGHTPSLCLKRPFPLSLKSTDNIINIRCYVCKQLGHLNCQANPSISSSSSSSSDAE